MKQKLFKFSGNHLSVLNIESIRTGLYQIAAVLFGVLVIMIIFTSVIMLLKNVPFSFEINSISEFFFASFFVFLTIIIPAVSLILAGRMPPAPKVHFDRDSNTVHWRVGEKKIEIPYDKIAFEKRMFTLKNGMASYSVMVRAVSKTPFTNADKLPEREDQVYIKDLCMYNAGTSAEADESIEIIKMFMSEKWEAYSAPSKFDDI